MNPVSFLEKPTLLFFFLGTFFCVRSVAQVSMTFCNNLDSQNNLSGFSSTFTIPSNGAYIYFVLEVGDGKTFNTHKLAYDIYLGDKFKTTLYSDIDPSWGQCWKKVTLYEAGDYRVDVYDMEQYNSLWEKYGMWISSGYVTITYQ